ncbi:hypothetical protein QE152_g32210 [Popillia japonica]|uniref:Endonuclease/exonuclease/phosphatase domain-containing protein n=1 Tax=Popillia japonica TaxID=7064 RepID=A0AAW1J012_POPJA
MSITIGSINVRSLFTGFDELRDTVLDETVLDENLDILALSETWLNDAVPDEQILIDENLDILALSETWLNDAVPDEQILIPNYNIYRCDQPSRGEGVAISVWNTILCKVICSGNNNDLEFIFIKFRLSNKTYGVGCLYRAPISDVTMSLSALESLMSEVFLVVDEVICLGDLNINLFNINTSKVEKFYSFCESFGLTQVINEPTRITAYSSTLIDVVLVTVTDASLVAGVRLIDLPSVSDHMFILATLNIKNPRETIKMYTYRDFSTFEIANFSETLKSIEWHNVYLFDDVNMILKFINDNILYLC